MVTVELVETRFRGDSKTADMHMRVLIQVRDHLLKKAGLEEGKVVLDVGADKHVNTAMLNFNERDLVQMCVAAGFPGVRTELYLNVGRVPAMNWDALMRSSRNPLIPRMAR